MMEGFCPVCGKAWIPHFGVFEDGTWVWWSCPHCDFDSVASLVTEEEYKTLIALRARPTGQAEGGR